ncbi:HPt (histidine-containing phosphotransfer) domain-containing protein [Albidovulum inexpectatum]|uniref:HPt (Histidine-containing phosphotransfer) domain-containing protein n=1 Tax=Albidovulum inexpectatum TaxID=196587 RepID=A0A2S5JML5_9RHOB|nr:Hpt domain-containing protein [Albidovulum inexpectatum]PPB82641.1 HPt (histidine-containing phosphotransfer) domain-containing protein [Albidovulum inexpectatum]
MIDWDHIDQLRQELGRNEFLHVVTLFLDEVQEAFDRLKRATDAGQLRSDLHFLKGAALNLGFRDLAAKCRTDEAMLAAGRSDAVDLASIIDCFTRSRSAFLSGLDQRGETLPGAPAPGR